MPANALSLAAAVQLLDCYHPTARQVIQSFSYNILRRHSPLTISTENLRSTLPFRQLSSQHHTRLAAQRRLN